MPADMADRVRSTVAAADDQPALPACQDQARQLAQWAAITGCQGAGCNRRRGNGAVHPGPPASKHIKPYLSVDQNTIRRAFELALT